MEDYIGRNLKIKTIEGSVEGILETFDKESGIITILNQNIKKVLNFDDVTGLDLNETPKDGPLKEEDMYSLFYEAFNIYGPIEEHFVLSVASALKKFIKDLSTASIKIIIGSDDVFGRIGLAFARIIYGRVANLSIEFRSEIRETKTQLYKNMYTNSGGVFTNTSQNVFSLVLFASNRHSDFGMKNMSTSQTILLDIPSSLPFINFTALGLGFIPENSQLSTKFFYLLDVGFGIHLCKKYGLPTTYKNSLMRIEPNR